MTGGHRRILVVEDDPEQLMEQLTTSGYRWIWFPAATKR